MSKNADRRLWLAVTRLLFGLIAISFFLYYFVTEIQRYVYYDEVMSNIAVVTYFDGFVRSISSERGKSVLFLIDPSDDPNITRSEITEIQQLTNAQIPHILVILGGMNSPDADRVIGSLKNVSMIQQAVLVGGISYSDLDHFYSELTDQLIDTFHEIIFYNYAELTMELHSMLYMNWYLEWLGKERILTAKVLVNLTVGNKQSFCKNYFGIQQTQKFILEQLKISFSDTSLNQFLSVESDPSMISALNTINTQRSEIRAYTAYNYTNTNNYTFSFNISVTDWWNNMTFFIDHTESTISILLLNISNILESYQSTIQTGLVIAFLGLMLEILTSVQLIWITLPVFKVYFLWSLRSSGSRSISKSKNIQIQNQE